MQWTKAPCPQRLGEHHTRVRGSSVGVFVTDTRVSEVDKILSDGAAAAPLPSLLPEGSGQEDAGSWGTCPDGERGAGAPRRPSLLPGAGL